MSDLNSTEFAPLPQEIAKDLFWASSKLYKKFGRGAIHIDLNDLNLLKIFKDYREGKKNKQKLANNLSYIPLSLEQVNLSGDPDVDSLLKDLHDRMPLSYPAIADGQRISSRFHFSPKNCTGFLH